MNLGLQVLYTLGYGISDRKIASVPVEEALYSGMQFRTTFCEVWAFMCIEYVTYMQLVYKILEIGEVELIGVVYDLCSWHRQLRHHDYRLFFVKLSLLSFFIRTVTGLPIYVSRKLFFNLHALHFCGVFFVSQFICCSFFLGYELLSQTQKYMHDSWVRIA